jgi:hypothetical protein
VRLACFASEGAEGVVVVAVVVLSVISTENSLGWPWGNVLEVEEECAM